MIEAPGPRWRCLFVEVAAETASVVEVHLEWIRGSSFGLVSVFELPRSLVGT